MTVVWFRLTTAAAEARPVTDSGSGGQLLTGELLAAFLRHYCSSAHQPRLCSTLSLYLETVVTCAAALLGGGGARIGSIRHPRTSHSHIQDFQTDADVRTKLLFNFLEMYLLTDNNLKI